MRRVRYVVLPIILFALAGPSRGTDGHDFRACPGHRLAYTFARLEVPGTFGGVRAINNAGRAVGNFYDESGLAHAFLFRRGEFTQLVDLPGFTTPEPFGMNEAGQIVGLDWHRGRGVFWRTSTAAPIELETLGGNGSLGYAVNNSGQIVGYADLPGNVRRAAIWRHGGAAPTELGSLGGSDNAAVSINNRGQIVGLGTLPDNTGFRALWWQNSDTPPLDLGTLGGIGSIAWDINNRGQIAGYAYLPDGTYHAVLWQRGTLGLTDLGTLPGFPYSEARAINDVGQIVGIITTIDNVLHAALWHQGVLIDLNTFLPADSEWTLLVAIDINNVGQVAGWYSDADGVIHGYLATPACHREGYPF